MNMTSYAATTTATTTTTQEPASEPAAPPSPSQQQAAAQGGATQQQASASGQQAGPSTQPQERLVLRLRPRRKKGVTWTNDTVDNENMGKKKSKKCCIFHKQKRFGDWSDSDSSDSDCGGSDGECADCREPPEEQNVS